MWSAARGQFTTETLRGNVPARSGSPRTRDTVTSPLDTEPAGAAPVGVSAPAPKLGGSVIIRDATSADLDGIFAITIRKCCTARRPSIPCRKRRRSGSNGLGPRRALSGAGGRGRWPHSWLGPIVHMVANGRAYDRTGRERGYVHEDARGRGVGRLLLQELIRQAPAAWRARLRGAHC